MAEVSFGQMIGPAVVLMGAAVVAVPLFQRLGLGSVLGIDQPRQYADCKLLLMLELSAGLFDVCGIEIDGILNLGPRRCFSGSA